MADLFQCDKCGKILRVGLKKGRLTLQELQDGMPHASLYNNKADVCEPCFKMLRDGMNMSAGPQTAESTQKILAGT